MTRPATAPLDASDLSPDEIDRYARQILVPKIGAQGQVKLKNAVVWVAGCGGIGAHLSPLLAGMGIGRIVLFDFDRIERGNLPRQTLYDENDVGAYKAEVAARKLAAMNSDSQIEYVLEKIGRATLGRRSDHPNAACDGTDDPETRGVISDCCRSRGIPLITGALAGLSGQWAAFDYRSRDADYPCLRCLYPDLDDLPPGGCAHGGIIGPVCAVVAGMMAAMTMRLIVEAEEAPRPPALHLWHADDGRIDALPIVKRAGCGGHGGSDREQGG